MVERNGRGERPPEPPPEYVEAYRRAYEGAHDPGPDDEPTVAGFDPFRDEDPYDGPLHADEAGSVEELEDLPRGRPAWLVPVVLVGLVVVLLAGAYVVGRAFSGSLGSLGGTGEAKGPERVVIPGEDDPPASSAPHTATGKAYRGPTEAAAIGSVSASCEAEAGVDAAGRAVRYGAANTTDGDLTTAWRCDGSGRGEQLTITLAGPTRVGEVGLVPGYAKTDPRSGEDRYRQNNRITSARWTFSDGTTVKQTFDPSPGRRTLQTMRIPVTTARSVVVEVLASVPGPRNTVAVSEVRVGRVAR